MLIRVARALRCPALISAAGLLLGGCGHAAHTAGAEHPATKPSILAHAVFGAYAGYVTYVPVTSATASWTVPRVVAGSPAGRAGTWVGAEAPATGVNPFIQVGINEFRFPTSRRRPADDVYFAFWSDTAHDFHPFRLFAVRPGDRVTASLQHEHDRWTIAIADATSGAHARFSTSEEGRWSFNAAKWLQEDITNLATHRPFPYPTLSPVRFDDVTVDGGHLSAQNQYTVWMSDHDRELAPSGLVNNSFSIRLTQLGATGARYLELSEGIEDAVAAVQARINRPRAARDQSALASAAARLAATTRSAITTLDHSAWPTSASTDIGILVSRLNALLSQTLKRTTTPGAQLGTWNAGWSNDLQVVDDTDRAIRDDLGLPDITPTG